MSRTLRQQRVTLTTALVAAFLLVLALLGVVYVFYAGADLVEIRVPDFVAVNKDETGAYTFSLDTVGIREQLYFPEDDSYPENKAADSLSLIANASGSSYSFQTGSTLSNVNSLLKQGGYKLVSTAWTWTAAEAEEAYRKSLSAPRTLYVDKFTVYTADGNGNFSASFDAEAAKAYVGDRVKSNPVLAGALEGLTVTSSGDGNSLKMDTWTTFSAETGVGVNTVFEACNVTVKNISFSVPLDQIREASMKEYSLVPCYVLTNDSGELKCELDRTKIKDDLGFRTGTTAAAAIDSLRVQVTKTVSGWKLEVCSVLADVDAVGILRNNGVKLTDLSMSVTE